MKDLKKIIFKDSLSDLIFFHSRLCSEQLSYQTHYEYGLRAVKAVLDAAARFRVIHQKEEEEDEHKIILRAMMDINLPKFVSEDIPLFKYCEKIIQSRFNPFDVIKCVVVFRSIIHDMFPQTEFPQVDRMALVGAIKEKCVEFRLQSTPWFVDKVLQLYEMVLVR